ncbi:MAG: DUF6351 family protein [Sulfurifustaceae bacterium]
MTTRLSKRHAAMAMLLVGTMALGGAAIAHDVDHFQISTLSNRADLISGGDALVEVSVPPRVDLDDVVITLNGNDVTGMFTRNTDARTFRGLVTGLNVGENQLAAGVKVHHRIGPGGDETAIVEKLTITNHPIGGPVFSGNQIQPWICATPTPQPGSDTVPHTNPSGLHTFATDAQCNIATEVFFWYKSTGTPATCSGIAGPNACLKPYNVASPPSDVAMTTTDKGVTVPFIVRQERGTIDRGIYDVAVLWDPSKPASQQTAWNGKLQYAFGVASGSPRRQFAPNTTWFTGLATNDLALGLGFMTAASSLTDHQLNSNLAVAAEALMMIKEHIIEQYGPIRYTMGVGCSGGSIEQNVISSQYPGLIDGLQISCTYPDSITTGLEVGDCVLLTRYFNSAAFAALNTGLTTAQINAKRAAIAGHLSQLGCLSWVAAFGNTGQPGNIAGLPSVGSAIFATTPRAEFPNNCLLPRTFVYEPGVNDGGLRCSPFDHGIAIWGNAGDPAFPTRANVTTDNTGVQYGLKALLAGSISAEDFVVLNEKVGSVGFDGRFQGPRAVADDFALRTAYRSGTVGDGRSWAKVPIIDLRGNDNNGIHHIWRSFALRARLDQANGHHANHVMWRFGPGLLPTLPASAKLFREQFFVMDKWLSNMEADTSHKPLEQKVLDDKPAEAFDYCYLSTDTTFSTKVTDFSVCDADPVLAVFSSPRQVSGGPLAENILKCQLKALDRNDYPAGTFTDEQWARLQAVFSTGVCDWSQPGVQQRPAVTNLTYEAGPGGKRLGRAPESH